MTVPPPPNDYYQPYGPPPPKRSVTPWIIAGIVVLVLVLGSCAAGAYFLVNNDDNPAPRPSPTLEIPLPSPTPEVSVEPGTCAAQDPLLSGNENRPTDEATFIQVLSIEETGFFCNSKGDTAIRAGQNICTWFDQGLSFNAVVDKALDAGLSGYASDYLIGSAVRNLCPRNLSKLPR